MTEDSHWGHVFHFGLSLQAQVGSNDARRLFLIRIDEDGTVVWERTYGVTSTNGSSVERTRDGRYIISGSTNIDMAAWFTGGNGSEFYLVKTDRLGNTQ